ncbi:hypothetical protein WSM22_32960 [Cytophagales bacterium WSM2-2]|nr:hypothetical protein WSM22_32960 [Cytophagales bacterium WSM2-2]
MFSIFKRNKDNSGVPEWASFFNESEYSDFLKAIDKYFNKKKITYQLGDGILTIGANDFGSNKLGLINVAQVCKQDELKNYNGIVFEHFESMVRASLFDAEFRKIVHDFDKVKKYVGVRLYPKDYPAQLGKELAIWKDFVGDICSMLVFDLPDSIINVQPEQAKKWGRSFDELFDVGLQNVRSNYPLDISQQKFNEFTIWFIQGNHFFTPNIVFDLNNYPQFIGSKGSLIGIPHRHSAIIYPIENLEVVTAINQLIPTIYGISSEGPGSLSNNLFWYKDGHFENLPYKFADEKLQFFPPDNFVDLLNTLTEKK